MTVDEIKHTYSMREIVERYGIQIKRDGMCSCPFHGKDRKPSMKIYKDSYFCFTCHNSGDIFTFIQKMDNCDFKTAFYQLGGEYEKQSDKARMISNAKFKQQSDKRKRLIKTENDFKKEMIEVMDLANASIQNDNPFSDRWCLSQNFLPKINHWWETKMIEKEEVPIPSVHRVCAEFRRKYNSSSGTI